MKLYRCLCVKETVVEDIIDIADVLAENEEEAIRKCKELCKKSGCKYHDVIYAYDLD